MQIKNFTHHHSSCTQTWRGRRRILLPLAASEIKRKTAATRDGGARGSGAGDTGRRVHFARSLGLNICAFGFNRSFRSCICKTNVSKLHALAWHATATSQLYSHRRRWGASYVLEAYPVQLNTRWDLEKIINNNLIKYN